MPQLDAGARDREIGKALPDERKYLVATDIGADEIGIRFVKRKQAISERGKFEEVVFFRNLLVRLPCFRVDVARLGIVYERFAHDRIQPGIGSFVDVAIGLASFEQLIDELRVIGGGGPLEAVDSKIKVLPLGAEFIRDQIDKLFRRFILCLSGSFYFRSVLVGTGRENDVIALMRFTRAIVSRQ